MRLRQGINSDHKTVFQTTGKYFIQNYFIQDFKMYDV